MGKIRVLHVLEERKFGGAYTFITTLIQGMDTSRFESTICMIGRKPQDTEKEDFLCNFVHCQMNGIWDLRSIMKVEKVIQELQVDIVHTHLPRADVIGRTAAWLARVPKIFTTIHALDQHWKRKSRLVHALADRATLHFATKVICVSTASRKYLCERYPGVADRVITIRNGIDLRRFKPRMGSREAKRVYGLSGKAPVVGVTARLRPVKGVEYLLMAVQKLIAKNISVDCLVVGDGESRVDLEALAEKLGVQNQVVFAGYCEDVDKALAAIDLFVLPSLSEGLPTCLMEAMAMRKPVIATAVGGVPEVITNGETGILVPARDPERLATAIADLLSESEKAEKMAERGYREVLRRFDRRNMIQAYELLYLECAFGHVGIDECAESVHTPLSRQEVDS